MMAMRAFTSLIFLSLLFWGCSDLGTDVGSNWKRYDLPQGYISLPGELTQRKSVAALPENPEYEGVVGNQRVRVQFCIHTPLWEAKFQNYQEQTLLLHGRKVVMFRGVGFFHLYDSSLSTIIGAKAYLGSGEDPVVVAVQISQPEGEEVASGILMTLHP